MTKMFHTLLYCELYAIMLLSTANTFETPYICMYIFLKKKGNFAQENIIFSLWGGEVRDCYVL